MALLRRPLSRTSQGEALNVVVANLSRPAWAAGEDIRDGLASVDDVLIWWP
ncbi:hypothetical protein [Streptomyces sp. NPDC005890]|uniref:hypothetical protein n=1 Tax=Streptomyces sp. NPDC005890 TaxID=3154568 RepID=UPI0033F5410F